jgi:hypothetical protein
MGWPLLEQIAKLADVLEEEAVLTLRVMVRYMMHRTLFNAKPQSRKDAMKDQKKPPDAHR